LKADAVHLKAGIPAVPNECGDGKGYLFRPVIGKTAQRVDRPVLRGDA
jgi:hypothetical protein